MLLTDVLLKAPSQKKMGLMKTPRRTGGGVARLDKVNLQELKADVPADVCFLWSTKLGRVNSCSHLNPFHNSGKRLLCAGGAEAPIKNTRALMEKHILGDVTGADEERCCRLFEHFSL